LGKFGEDESHALETGELRLGWKLPDLSDAAKRDQILSIVRETYPNEKSGTLNNWSVQLNQFKNTVAPEDLAIIPLKTSGQLAIGRFQGGYKHTSDGRPARLVEWLKTDLPRDALQQDLLYSLGASQTVCEVSRNDAVKRIEALLQKGSESSSFVEKASFAKGKNTDEVFAESEAMVDLETLARDQIERHISRQFSGHAFTNLVDAILKAQGFETRVSPPGADKGIDIVAGRGHLGFEGPHLVVQVKSGSVVVDQPTLQSLLGCLSDTRAEHGLLVSWAGFTSAVRQRANELYFRVRMWGRKEVVDALLAVYDRLPEEIRSELPLRRIWTIVSDEQ
jgi:restriction system protein